MPQLYVELRELAHWFDVELGPSRARTSSTSAPYIGRQPEPGVPVAVICNESSATSLMSYMGQSILGFQWSAHLRGRSCCRLRPHNQEKLRSFAQIVGIGALS